MSKFIHVIDNPFGKAFHEKLYDYVINSYFKIGSQDGPSTLDRRNNVYIHSDYGIDDVNRIGILDKLNEVEEWQPYKDYKLIRTTINVSVPSDTNFPHTHKDQISLIYYVNLDWKPEWAGETVFYNDDLTEITYMSMYKPGRMVLFDGEIPHSIRPQSNSAPHYRFTLAMFFNK
jgi:hypothetical protein